jgi:branched-chain amino acid transport system permease protein
VSLVLADGGASLLVLTLFNALTEGSTYALIAVGYTMVYGIVRLINFAHGEVYMIGGVTAWWLFSSPQVPLWLALPLSMALCAGLGWLLERVAYRPLRGSTRLTALITAIGMSLILQTAVQLLLSPNPQSFKERPEARCKADGTRLHDRPEGASAELALLNAGKSVPLWREPVAPTPGWVAVAWQRAGDERASAAWLRADSVTLQQGLPEFLNANLLPAWAGGGDEPADAAATQAADDRRAPPLKLPAKDVVIWVVSAAMMLGLHLLVQRTRLGKAMRACALDMTTAALMGIDVNRVIAATFMIGSAMAAVAGVLYSIKVGGQIKFNMGYYPGVIAFTAAVLGGIGNLKGALLGGMLLGVCRAFWATYSGRAEYDFAFCFSVMIVVVIVRPYGLLGRPSATRA